MMPSDLIGSEIQGKITGPRNIGHSDIQEYEVTRSVKPNKYQKYDAYLLLDREPEILKAKTTEPCNIDQGQIWVMH